jgi:hypothetical protein
LDLGRNIIGDAGAAALAAALEKNTTLTRLDLGRNNIGDVGAGACKTIEDILAWNRKFKDTKPQIGVAFWALRAHLPPELAMMIMERVAGPRPNLSSIIYTAVDECEKAPAHKRRNFRVTEVSVNP